MKKVLLLSATLLLAIITNAQIVNIPDANFRVALLAHDPVIDTNGDNEIQVAEAEVFADTINVSNKEISDFTGVETFINLKGLICYHNQLISLDLSINTSLDYLDCSYNQLTNLNISNNTELINLRCNDNQLINLDLSVNTNITKLVCGNNQLTSLDISNNASLTNLWCGENQLTSLDVSNNIVLTFLGCDGNQLISLDLSNNIALDFLQCYNNQISSLDLSNNIEIHGLNCAYNEITIFDFSNCDSLEYLRCDNNQLTSLDLSNYTGLNFLNCSDNQITSLNVKNGNNTNFLSNFGMYDYFDARNNPNLTCIEVDDAEWSTNNWLRLDAQTSFSEDCTDGITDIKSLTGLIISPNPFTDRVEVALEKHSDYKVRLLDILGKELLATQFNGTSYTLSTSELPKGTYLMQISSKDGVRVEKVVKQ